MTKNKVETLYDIGCHKLAEKFIEDYSYNVGALSKREAKHHSHQLAQQIQHTIEDYIKTMNNQKIPEDKE